MFILDTIKRANHFGKALARAFQTKYIFCDDNLLAIKTQDKVVVCKLLKSESSVINPVILICKIILYLTSSNT